MIKRLILALAALSWAGCAFAQSAPGLYVGQVPTAAQWNSFFSAKQDYVPGALTVLGPGASVASDVVCWNATYPQVYDCGAMPTVLAGTGATVTASGHNYTVSVALPAVIPRDYLAGLTLSTAGSVQTFSVSAGQATDSTNAAIMSIATFSKTAASTWTAGTGNGCVDTGSVANSTWYHIYLIERTDKSAVDILCSLSASAPTMPTNWSFFRRIGSMLTNGSAQWVGFVQVGDEFRWTTPAQDINTATLSTTATPFTLSIPPSVPVLARIRGFMSSGSAGTYLLISSPLVATPVVGTPAGEYTVALASGTARTAFVVDVLTQNQQLVAVGSASGTTAVIDTYGWTDYRGRNN